MKNITIILTFFLATSAMAGDFQCTYTFKRNSVSLKGNLTPITELTPPAKIALDDPSSGNLRARLVRNGRIDGHKFEFVAVLSKTNYFSVNISDNTPENERYAHADVNKTTQGQVVNVQYNFSPKADIVTLVTASCSFTE